MRVHNSQAEILELCDKRRELRKKRFEPERSENYSEVGPLEREESIQSEITTS